jgi:hypothetical protein
MIETQDGSFSCGDPPLLSSIPGGHGPPYHGRLFLYIRTSIIPLTLSHIHFNSMCDSTNGHASSAAQISSPNTKANALSTACLRHLCRSCSRSLAAIRKCPGSN